MTTPHDPEPAGRIAFSFTVTLEAAPNTPGIPTINLKRSARAAIQNALQKAYDEGFTHPLEDETELHVVEVV